MPNFEDAPDGSSSINNSSPEYPDIWDPEAWDDISFSSGPFPVVPPPSTPLDLNAAVGSAAAVSPPHDLNTAIGASHIARRSPWVEIVDSEGRPVPARLPASPPQTATQVNEARRRANPEWRPIPTRSPDAIGAVPPNPNPVGYSRDFLPPCSPPRRVPRRPNSRGEAVKKDPNAWSMREAVELCKLLEVVVPEAGFHIALTGGLLYKEGRRKDCDLMFYQIRQVEPNYEVLWKYLTVAGVIRHPGYVENGWLVKATYRGKAVDCLFPNAKKKKVVMGDLCSKQNAYQASSPTPPSPPHTVGEHNTAIGAHSLASNNVGTSNIPILYHRTSSALPPYDPVELLATPAPAPVPAAAEAQDDIPF